MNFKLLTLALSSLAFSVVASAAPAPKAKVRTNVKTKTATTRTTKGTSKAAEGFKMESLLGAAAADRQEDLTNANNALKACNGTPLIQDISKAMPSAAEQSSVLRFASMLGGKVQNCQVGEQITDAQSLVNFGRLIIYVGQAVEANGANASNVNVWAAGLKKAIETSGGKISLEQAKANIAGLQSSECKMLKGISI